MTFPNLISGELAQSSAVRTQPAKHSAALFEGFSRQSHRISDLDHRSWHLNYTNLTAEEAFQLRNFFEAVPVGGVFEFTDPWTSQLFTTCRMASPRLSMSCDRDNRYSVQLEIENAI